jgi:hypothetical protein
MALLKNQPGQARGKIAEGQPFRRNGLFKLKLFSILIEGKGQENVVAVVIQHSQVVTLTQVVEDYRVVLTVALLTEIQGHFIAHKFLDPLGLHLLHKVEIGEGLVRGQDQKRP